MLITMDGTALQRCFLMDGPRPDRVATLFTMDGTTLKRSLNYGQGHISTLFSMDGSAPKHSLLWAGPHRALITMGGPAQRHSLLSDGSAAGPHYYGQVRTRTAPGPHRALISMGGPAPGHSLLWAGPQRARIPMGGPATPFGPYKVISKRCEEDGLLHNAKLLSSIFTNQITLYLRPAPKRCFICILYVYAFCAFRKCPDDARHLPQTRYACNLDEAHFQFPCSWRACPHMLNANPQAGTFDSLTWAPAPCLACEMVPFFPNKSALHPCTLTVYMICIYIYIRIHLLNLENYNTL